MLRRRSTEGSFVMPDDEDEQLEVSRAVAQRLSAYVALRSPV